MRKIVYIALFSGFFSFIAVQPASAWIIAKISNMAEDATTAISKYGKDVQNQLDKVSNATVVKTIGKGFNEARDWGEKNVSKLRSFSDKVKEKTDKAKEYADGVKGAVDEVKNGDLAKSKAIIDDMKNIKAKQDQILAQMKEAQSDLNTIYDPQIAAADAERIGTLKNISLLEKVIKENPERQEELQPQLDYMQALADGYQKTKDQLSEKFSAELKEKLAPYQKEIKSLSDDYKKLGRDLKILLAKTEEQNPEEALTNTADLYFQAYDEAETPKRHDEIRRNRLLERRRSIITAYTESIAFIPELGIRDREGEDQGYAASTFDTTGGALGAEADMGIKNMKALRDYARLLTYDLKKQSATQLSLLTFYKLKKPQKNITEFNLDDYIYQGPKE